MISFNKVSPDKPVRRKSHLQSQVDTTEGEPPVALIGVSLKFLRNVQKALAYPSASNAKATGVRTTMGGKNAHSTSLTTLEVVYDYVKLWCEGSQRSLVEHLSSRYSNQRHPDLRVSYKDKYFADEANVFVSHCWGYQFSSLVEAIQMFEESAGITDFDDEDSEGEQEDSYSFRVHPEEAAQSMKSSADEPLVQYQNVYDAKKADAIAGFIPTTGAFADGKDAENDDDYDEHSQQQHFAAADEVRLPSAAAATAAQQAETDIQQKIDEIVSKKYGNDKHSSAMSPDKSSTLGSRKLSQRKLSTQSMVSPTIKNKHPQYYYWIDIFSLNQLQVWNPRSSSIEAQQQQQQQQYGASEQNNSESQIDLEAIYSLIERVGHTLAVTMPFKDPANFKRSWCLFELFASKAARAKISFQFSKKRHNQFQRLLDDNYDKAVASLGIVVDYESSSSTLPSDRIAISKFFLTTANTSFHEVNDLITRGVFDWVNTAALSFLQSKLQLAEDNAANEAAEREQAARGALSFTQVLCIALGCRAPVSTSSAGGEEADTLHMNPIDFETAKYIEQSDLKLRIAALLHELHRYEEAEAIYRTVLATNDHFMGKNHPSTLSILGNLALLYKTRGNYDEAEDLYRKVLRSKEDTLGTAHPSTLTTLQNLGTLLKESGRHDVAIAVFERSLVDLESELGAKHVDTLRCMEHLAHLYLDGGKREAAIRFLARILIIKREKYGGESNSVVAAASEVLAVLYAQDRRDDEAAELLQSALRSRELNFGKDHTITIATSVRLGRLQLRRGQLEHLQQAEVLLKRVMDFKASELGRLHNTTIDLLESYVEAVVKQRKFEDAERALLDLLLRREETVGPLGVSTLNTLYHIGELYVESRQYGLGLVYHQRCLVGRNEVLGVDHVDTASSQHSVGICFAYTGKVDEAKEYLHHALTTYDEQLGVTSEVAVNCAESLITVCTSRGDLQEAAHLVIRLRIHFCSKYGPKHEKTLGMDRRMEELRSRGL